MVCSLNYLAQEFHILNEETIPCVNNKLFIMHIYPLQHDSADSKGVDKLKPEAAACSTIQQTMFIILPLNEAKHDKCSHTVHQMTVGIVLPFSHTHSLLKNVPT